MNTPVISVVMPAHRSFSTIERALNSVLAQDFSLPFELVVSFDDRKDGTKEILEKYASTYPEIVRIHPKQKATGAAGSRYEALLECRGDLVCFLDSDDEMLPNYLSVMYQAQQKDDADCVNCSFYVVSQGKRSPNIFEAREAMDHDQWLDAFLNDVSFRGFTWTKLIRKSLLLQSPLLLLEEYSDLFEDVAFLFSCLMKAKKVVTIPNRLYLYYKDNSNSATSVPRKDRALHHIAVFACIRRYIERYGSKRDLRRFFAHKTRFYWSVWFDIQLDKKGGADSQYLAQVKKEFREVTKKNAPLQAEGAFYVSFLKRAFLA